MNTTLSEARPQAGSTSTAGPKEDALSRYEIAFRDELIENGQEASMRLLYDLNAAGSYYVHKGAVAGLEECRGFFSLAAFERRLAQLRQEESRAADVDFKEASFRPEPTALKEFAQLKGKRTQVEFVLERLRTFRQRAGV